MCEGTLAAVFAIMSPSSLATLANEAIVACRRTDYRDRDSKIVCRLAIKEMIGLVGREEAAVLLKNTK